MKHSLPKLGKRLQYVNASALWRQTQRQKKTMPDITSGCTAKEQSISCLVSYFYAMYGVKKLTNLQVATTGTDLALSHKIK